MDEGLPNVLFISVDCLRYDRCGFDGHHRNTTPTLDSIAGESYIFDRAYATGTYTTESVPGIIAGLHSHNGVYFGEDPAWKAIPSDTATITSHLQSAGYSTTAVLTNPHLSSERNFDSGFDEFRNLRLAGQTDRAAASQSEKSSSFTDGIHSWIRSSDVLYSSPVVFTGRTYQYLTDWPSIRGTDLIGDLFESLDPADSPFFAWTHFMDVHRPIHPDAARNDSMEYSPSLVRQFAIDANVSTDRFDPRFEALYDNAVRYVDDRIDEVIEWLQREDAWEDTLLIVTGDHGEALFDRGRYGHPRHYPYDELLHVPLLVRDPDGDAKRVSRPFSLAWLGELIADLIGISRPPFPAESGRRDHLGTAAGEESLVVSDALDAHGHSIAVQNRDYKYVRSELTENADPAVVYTPAEGGYRIDVDRGERNLLDPDVIPEQLREETHSIASSPSQLPKIEGEFSNEVERQLEQLGYKM